MAEVVEKLRAFQKEYSDKKPFVFLSLKTEDFKELMAELQETERLRERVGFLTDKLNGKS